MYVGAEEGCLWGDQSKPQGNWAPFVCGMNTIGTGDTFVTLGQNPISWKEYNTFASNKPTFGVKIECEGNCVGTPCSVDGNGVVTSATKATGAGGAESRRLEFLLALRISSSSPS